MRKSIKNAVGTTVHDMLKAGLKSTFTQKELDTLGVQIPEISMTAEQIKSIRQKTNLSQSVFAKLLNVSLSSVRQWEQGQRVPTGATKVLLELLDKSPRILDYRISA
ncbi:MAG: helix-turn-helix domain-containing protein [Proteobacteria bacterium]|nr:helix-turn-helix domain-containing protein [Pseudomonadota bacterium]